MKRQVMFPFRQTFDRPANCPLLPKTWHMLRAILFVHRQLRPRLLQVVASLPADKQVFVIRSLAQLLEFRREHCAANAA